MEESERVLHRNRSSANNRLMRDIPVDNLKLNRECITIVWFDSTGTTTDFSDLSLSQLHALSDYILVYSKKTLYLQYLTSTNKRNDYVIAVSDDLEIFDHTKNCEQVCAMLFIAAESDKQKSINIKDDKKKIISICTDRSLVLDQLQQVTVDVEHQVARNAENVFNTFNRNERALKDVRHEFALFMWRQVFKVMIKEMPHTVEARQELVDHCRSYYNGNQIELSKIDAFERDYNAANVAQWYTKSCFLFRLLNKALRTEDIRALYTFRYFISDLSKILETAHDKHSITRVYRGGTLSREELQNYKIGTLVAPNSFLSTSCDRRVAEQFIGLDPITGISPSHSREDQQQYVLFTINIDWDRSPDIHVADISGQSDFPDEKEILFHIGTTFEIHDIEYDSEHHLWRIDMQPSMEVAQHNREYNHYIQQRLTETNATLLFGILLTDMGEYEQSINYFEHLLQRMPDDHEDLANVYYSAARIYRFTNQNNKALEFLERAERLQRAKLPESNFDLARTLAGIASVYYELQDYDKELIYYQQSSNIYQKILPENHIEIARTFNRLGFAYANQQQYSLALDYLSKSLIVYNHTVPESHPDKAFALYNTGLVHHTLGNIDMSFEFFQKALTMRKITLPPNHPYIAQSYYRLSILYEEQGQYDSALEYAQQALVIYEKKPLDNYKLISEIQNMIQRILNEDIKRT